MIGEAVRPALLNSASAGFLAAGRKADQLRPRPLFDWSELPWPLVRIGKVISACPWSSCPVQLFPATSDSEKVSFHQINNETGNRVRYRKVDEETGEEVPAENIIKGYEVSKGQYVEITDEELEAIALESTKTIDIDEFVPRNEIDELYDIRPYYIAPDGKVGQDAFDHPSGDRRDGHGGHRPDRPHEPRAHHRAGAARQGDHGHAAAVSV